MNFFKIQTEKVSHFLNAGMWKLGLDVENEPPVKIEPPVLFELPIINELFLRNLRPPNNIEKKKYFMILKNWIQNADRKFQCCIFIFTVCFTSFHFVQINLRHHVNRLDMLKCVLCML